MGMTDYLAECNSGDLRIDPRTFRETWCARCSQPDCGLAKFAKNDSMAIRNATWQDRFFNANQADLKLPRFAQIAKLDFPNLIQKAMRLEISEQRGDWSVPEIAITDGRVVQADQDTTNQVEEAIRQLRGDSDVQPKIDDVDPSQVHEDTPILNPKSQVVRPQSGNTPDPGAVMIGGDPVTTKRGTPPPEMDSWAPPLKPKHLIIKPGASIQFGVGGKMKVLDD